jgi:hypothetical protein
MKTEVFKCCIFAINGKKDGKISYISLPKNFDSKLCLTQRPTGAITDFLHSHSITLLFHTELVHVWTSHVFLSGSNLPKSD